MSQANEAHAGYTASLSHSQLFHGIDLPILSDLIHHGQITKSPADSWLLTEGDKVPGLFVVLEGFVHVTRNGKTDVTPLGRGNFFGEISVFGLGIGASASVITPKGCTSLLVSQDELTKWFKKYPDGERLFLRHLAGELCRRLYLTTAKLN